MSKSLFIAEKPSVAREFAKTLGETFKSGDGFMESPSFVVTWCVGHLVAMSYPEKYDPALKKWRLETLPFIPDKYKYEVISGVKKQFDIVKKQLLRDDVDTIYVCTDSGREGEYIYRLVREQAGVRDKTEKRVWIDSQTEEEILKGIKTAKPLSEYDALSDSAYLRAKEDYLMGINFSRAMSLIYGDMIAAAVGKRYLPVAMGRVMTCVLGMIVKREREIRDFVPTPFFKVNVVTDQGFSAEWKVSETSRFFGSTQLYKDNGFLNKEDAVSLAEGITGGSGVPVRVTTGASDAGCANALRDLAKGAETGAASGTTDNAATEAMAGSAKNTVTESTSSLADNTATCSAGLADDGFTGCLSVTVLKAERKKEKKNPPLLYNLAELQNDCARIFKISPEATLKIAQELYEKKLTTYPRTDARVVSTAVCKEITKNIKGLKGFELVSAFAGEILEKELYKGLAKSKYCDDKKITDHYAIIPTGFGLAGVKSLSRTALCVYELIVRRFLAVFYPPSVHNKTTLTLAAETLSDGVTFTEEFSASFKVLADEGYLKVMKNSFDKRESKATEIPESVNSLKKGDKVGVTELAVRESETTPPKRYNSGSMILAMENAGQLIEDEELREHIKGSGIGTSATRAGILEKLDKNDYIDVNNKTQILTPTFTGEMIYDATRLSLSSLLSPELTASWEKGLTMVAGGEISADEYMEKLTGFVRRRTAGITGSRNQQALRGMIDGLKMVYMSDR